MAGERKPMTFSVERPPVAVALAVVPGASKSALG
jgi:hypothetical protein